MTFRIISRGEWGAQYDNGGGPAPIPASECWLHHSVTGAPGVDATFEQDAAAVRVLEKIGEDRFGQGISYTWVITPSGRIFEGHGVGRLGAHTANRNSKARAICYLGNYETTRPTTAQIRGAAWLLQHSHGRGWLAAARLNGGHRDVGQTACPGAHAYTRIGEINQLAAGPPITNMEDDDMGVLDEPVTRADNGKPTSLRGVLANIDGDWQRLARVEAKLDQLAGDLRDDEANVVAAVRQIVAADQDTEVVVGAEHVQALAAAVAAVLPPSVTPEQLAAAVADEQDRRARDSNPATGPAS